MKTTLKNILILVVVASFASCSAFRKAREAAYEADQAGRDKELKTFVMKTDSTIIPYDGIKIKTPLFGKSKFILDGDLTIPASEVLAYQTEGAYHTKTSLCGWTVKRNLIGPISRYQGYYTRLETDYTQSSTSINRTRSRTTYVTYLQKYDGSLIQYTPKNLYNMIQDHSPSVEIMDEYFKQHKKLNKIGLLNTVAYFAGGLVFLSGVKIDANSNVKIKGFGYGGLALATGGFVNGILTRKKRKTNNETIATIVEDYNWAIKKRNGQ